MIANATATSTASAIAFADPLPLFPLGTVLFPGGRLTLRIFEARYLDLISTCMRQGQAFGVVCLNKGGEVGKAEDGVRFESVGVLAELLDVDAEQAGILKVVCRGGQRFALQSAIRDPQGLWLASGVELIEADPQPALEPRYQDTAAALARAMDALAERDPGLFGPERHLDDAGWVANRWCELLPISLAAKQKLMELDEPNLRLSLVDDFLRERKVI
jgi:Lon protease-like protein